MHAKRRLKSLPDSIVTLGSLITLEKEVQEAQMGGREARQGETMQSVVTATKAFVKVEISCVSWLV